MDVLITARVNEWMDDWIGVRMDYWMVEGIYG